MLRADTVAELDAILERVQQEVFVNGTGVAEVTSPEDIVTPE